MENKKNKHKLPMAVLYRGLEEGNIICDITDGKPTTRSTNKIVTRVPAPKRKGARIKIEDNNTQLLDKIKGLPRRRTVWITFQATSSVGNDVEDMTITNLLTKNEYMAIYKPYKEIEKKMMEENIKRNRNVKWLGN